jgi:hypothetical protein
MIGLVIPMYIVGAGLTTSAIVRYLFRASRALRDVDAMVAERGHSKFIIADFDAQWGVDRRSPAQAARRDFCFDLALIGGGSAMSAAASILAIATG